MEKTKKSPSRETSEQLVAGAAAGGVADFCMHPIDTLRTRLQIQKANQIGAYKNTRDALSMMVQTEGWRALYKGVGIVLAATIPAHALYFAGYEFVKKYSYPSRRLEEKGPVVHFVAGLFADVCGSTVWVPMDVIKQRLQAQRTTRNNVYKNSFHTLVTIYKEEGIRGLFRGYWAALATYGPFVGVYFVCYEQCKMLSSRALNAPLDRLPFGVQLLNGAIAGAIAATVTCPMDVIKTRMQVQSKTASERYRGILDAVRTIAKYEGVGAFSKGLTARIVWIAPGTAITIALYEEFKILCDLV